MNSRIFFDNNATTSPFKEVVEAMKEELLKGARNPSSIHAEGQSAKATLINARETVAACLNVEPSWIVFTSGGTESMNMLINGYTAEKSCSILSSSLEHSSVYNPLKDLQNKGYPVRFLSSKTGRIDLSIIESACNEKLPDLMVFSAANSETGVIHPIDQIGSFADQMKIPLIVDGVALLGKEPFTMYQGISAIGFAGHKFHAPKGIGFCVLRPKKGFSPLLKGGAQESNRRAGTENLAGIVGLAVALKTVQSTLKETNMRIRALRDLFERELKKIYPPLFQIGEGDRLCNTSSVAFPTKDGETLLIALDQAGISASHGSACSSGAMQPSRVLQEMQLDPKIIRSGIRFSFSRFTTEEEIHEALRRLKIILG
jgi:cysteine desulfurase